MDKIFLTIKEISIKLGVSEKTIYRMIKSQSIPFAIKIGGQWRFNAEKIDRWMVDSRNNQHGDHHTNDKIKIIDALLNGSIIYRAHGKNRDEILDEILETIGETSAQEGTEIKKRILYSESIVSSSLKGISLMAPESHLPPATDNSKLFIVFLENGMNFKAIDHTQTEIVLLLLTANKTERLILKTRLQRLLMEESFVCALKEQPHRRDLTELITSHEEKLFTPIP